MIESIIKFFGSLNTTERVTIIGIIVTLLLGIWNLFIGFKNNKKTLFVNAITSERVKWMGELKELLAEYLSLTTIYEQKPILSGESLTKYLERLIFLQNKIKLHLNYVDYRDEEINKLISKINTKIFGMYDVKSLLDLPAEERFEALTEKDKQKYFNRVLSKMDEDQFLDVFKTNDKTKFINLANEAIKEANLDLRKEFGYQGRDDLISNTDELVEKSRRYLKEEWEKVKKEAIKGKLKKQSWYEKFINWILGF